jgi:hypothetical protein
MFREPMGLKLFLRQHKGFQRATAGQLLSLGINAEQTSISAPLGQLMSLDSAPAQGFQSTCARNSEAIQ